MSRIPLAYTFGNHMHWVDMQWLWGYDVLPGSTEDMLKYCRDLGVKGNVNFDGIGYEKMAAESPEHLAMLREAIAEGIVEVVGASYGQPYGLFQGGESNVRQRIYGVRTAIRVLGNRPRTFWEEEFDFCPQLPQMLASCGFTGASLYFQWTWHTPEVPVETVPVVLWEGIDGTQIPTATRNRMNMHQWPEEFHSLLNDLAQNPPLVDEIPPLVLQWLELMPTQDWMCRSELIAPMLEQLQQDPRFELIAVTLGEYLEKWKGSSLPVRHYRLDDVWHGMTLGKNGDNHPTQSARLEHEIMEAEVAAAILGLFGRPYEPWDVYPTWEFDEMWRNLLTAQHHDNHECEGLCGHVAEAQFAFINQSLSKNNPIFRLAKRFKFEPGEALDFNGYGWPVKANGIVAPSMGYQIRAAEYQEHRWTIEGDEARFDAEGVKVRIDIQTGTILELTTNHGSIENLPIRIMSRQDGNVQVASVLSFEINDGDLRLALDLDNAKVNLNFYPHLKTDDLLVTVWVQGDAATFQPGYAGAVSLQLPCIDPNVVVRTNAPYSVHEIDEGSKGRRKYPEGDWMTSPQWFESIERAFSSLSFVDFARPDGSGLLITQPSTSQWFRTDDGFENVLLTRDPWDGDKAELYMGRALTLFPHGKISNADCVKRAVQYGHYSHGASAEEQEFVDCGHPMPRDFSAVTVHSENVLATAFYREQESYCRRDLPTYAGLGTGHPYVLRLVEFDGIEGDIEITLPGPIAKAYKTNLMGEILEELPLATDAPHLLTSRPDLLTPFGIDAVRAKVHVRPHEIVTLYLDIVPGRKQFRDLDAKREVWATAHRTEE